MTRSYGGKKKLPGLQSNLYILLVSFLFGNSFRLPFRFTVLAQLIELVHVLHVMARSPSCSVSAHRCLLVLLWGVKGRPGGGAFASPMHALLAPQPHIKGIDQQMAATIIGYTAPVLIAQFLERQGHEYRRRSGTEDWSSKSD